MSEVVKDNQGKNISSQNDRMSRWRQHFQSFLNPSNSSPSDDLPPSVEKKPYDVELGRPTRAEILKTIKTLKKHKSLGEDGLPPELYKKCPEVTAEQIHGILQDV